MTPGQRLVDYLLDMLEAVRLARSYVGPMSDAEFFADRRTQQAVILNFLVIGEAATQLSTRFPEYPATHPEVPWQSLRGMRNRMAHGYFSIDLPTVLDTVKRDLPELEDKLATLVAKS